MTPRYRTLTAGAALLTLAACGGGGGGGSNGPNTVFQYQTFDSTVAGTSNVTAVGLEPGTGGVPQAAARHTGTMDRTNKALNIAGLIIDSNGIQGDVWEGSGVTLVKANHPDLDGTYDYLVPVLASQNGGSTIYLVGVTTRSQDVPTRGSATYSGQAVVGYITDVNNGSGGNAGSGGGNMTLTADFLNNNIDMVLSQLAMSGMTFNEVRINGLNIGNGAGGGNRSQFSHGGGTTVALRGGESLADVIGTTTSTQVRGTFYGGENGAPAEAGASFVVNGSDGVLYGIAAADERLN
ncbi:transferrin-binding protein-like solute binding protein [Oceanomicrobium pacificus]|uniref:Transferrin-binding protein B C-lobe/N-lobe beta-barrel domain-containing protein n=1 Tax=Oceanomicrobium pacificus TaxID=2692916 RepID=A0A6B0U0E5_9RHOB|nr:transferrin-binding protein-like solute binding protein [Oceanomicrobium pacificus]MXU66694.1 hypothetical protein [Oceanomicrobium pacificus]